MDLWRGDLEERHCVSDELTKPRAEEGTLLTGEELKPRLYEFELTRVPPAGDGGWNLEDMEITFASDATYVDLDGQSLKVPAEATSMTLEMVDGQVKIGFK